MVYVQHVFRAHPEQVFLRYFWLFLWLHFGLEICKVIRLILPKTCKFNTHNSPIFLYKSMCYDLFRSDYVKGRKMLNKVKHSLLRRCLRIFGHGKVDWMPYPVKDVRYQNWMKMQFVNCRFIPIESFMRSKPAMSKYWPWSINARICRLMRSWENKNA